MDEGRDAQGFLTWERIRGLFDRAVEHWNAGRFFEAHEDWETIWHEAEGVRREWIQGLIQAAAAFVHVERGRPAGFARLMGQAWEKLEGYAGETHGLDADALARVLGPWRAHAARVGSGASLADGAPAAPPRLRYRAGVTPCPLPPEPVEEASDA